MFRMYNNIEKLKQYRKNYYLKNKDILREKIYEWRKKNPDKVKSYLKKCQAKYKLLALTYYGGKPPMCNCCKEDIYEFLSIDHINGGGKKHRDKIKRHQLYDWLVNNNFPDGFQVLCFNCNFAKGHFGECPHKK